MLEHTFKSRYVSFQKAAVIIEDVFACQSSHNFDLEKGQSLDLPLSFVLAFLFSLSNVSCPTANLDICLSMMLTVHELRRALAF